MLLLLPFSVLLLSLGVPLSARTAEELVERGRQLYDAGQFASAAAVWEDAASESAARGDVLSQAIALSNLSSALQELGKWEDAKTAIAQSLDLIQSQPSAHSTPWLKVLAQALNTQGSLQFAIGQAETAIVTWERAADTYRQAGDDRGIYRAQVNRALALQALGLYQRSLETLKALNATVQQQPVSLMKATALRSLGNALRLVGDLDESEQLLQQSLTVAQQLRSPVAIGESLIALGNTARAKQDITAALDFYQQAATTAQLPQTKVQAQLNALSLLIEGDRDLPTNRLDTLTTLVPQIQEQLNQLPASRTAIYARIKLAQSLMKIAEGSSSNASNSAGTPNTPQIAPLLVTAVQQARTLDDRRAESYALGNLGTLYEKNQQLAEAQQLTEQALNLAAGINSLDIAYRWQWQLGRLLKERGDIPAAIAAYSQAVNSLESLRLDLVTTNREVQFSFRDSVEPVYRELVSLLLRPGPNQEPSQENLSQALQAIESLKLAELDNFFRDACVDAKPVELDKQQVDSTAAIFYPIILDDRLEVILSLPGQSLRHHTIETSKTEIEKTLLDLRKNLVTRTSRNYFTPAQTVYEWLIEPIEAQLAEAGVKTLVFVPDGLFRNIPMGALYDGEKFLLEKYGVAITPGLKLIDPKPLKRLELKGLTAGISEGRLGLPPLPNVKIEVNEVHSELSGVVLLNELFTRSTLQQEVLQTPFPVIHIATHGQFGSKAEDTFILAWDERINVNELDNLLRGRDRSNSGRAIELLVLSACQTATGDNRAALGLAGMAVRAGARSTLATLWYIDDAATVPLMVQFYNTLNESNVMTKAEALRRAQLSLLQNRSYQHPIYWAPYVLVGNWL